MTKNATKEPSTPSKSRLRRFFILALRLSLALGLLGSVGLAVSFWVLSYDLPTFETLESYDPPQISRVYSSDGLEVGSFFRERRTVVSIESIPTYMKQAVIAAEDEHFYEHEGVDYLGILRAAIKNVVAGRVKQGASTITQQVVKTFLLTPERKIKRKIREMILARRLEKNLSKDEILALYLNQIYLGHGRYGVEEAARFYFGKSIKDISLSEAAILAGLPKSPAYYSPLRFPNKARSRRHYVLSRMVVSGFISEEQAKAADAEAVVVVSDEDETSVAELSGAIGANYLEEVRRRLVPVIGEDRLLEGGLRIEIAMNARIQASAERAMREGLHVIDHRQGFRGPLGHLGKEDSASLVQRFQKEISRRKNRGQRMLPWVWDLTRAIDFKGSKEKEAQAKNEIPMDLVVPQPGQLITGLVSSVTVPDSATVSLGSGLVQLSLKDLRWARPFDPTHQGSPPRSIAELFSPNDLVTLRILETPTAPEAPESSRPEDQQLERPSTIQNIRAELSQVPKVQGALVAIDPRDRRVLAMVGGYDGSKDSFNRATQARRQPGSSFKPYVYGAAIDTELFTAASRVLDAPEVFHDPWTGKVWKPQNYSHSFDGELSLRKALARSKNIVAVRLIAKIGVDTVVDFARRAGIQSKLPRVMPLALGAGEVIPMEHINALATIAAMGVRASPRLVLAVTDRKGKFIYGDPEEGEETLKPAVTYVLADLMTSVMSEGTGRKLNKLGRRVAAKTGTASDQKDAWFVGFTPEIVCGAWVGFDNPTPMGASEFGSKAAGPIWLATMEEGLRDIEPSWYDPPEGLIFVRVDPNSGLMALPEGPGDYEPFVVGTEPTEFTPAVGSVSPADFLTLDPRAIP